MDATMDTIGGNAVLRFERKLAHPPEKVWKAITDPAEMAHWFPAAVETELKVGAKMRFTFPEEAPIDAAEDGEILEFDPPKVYAFRWNQDVLRLELVPDGAGCRLFFSQTLGGGSLGRLGAGRNAAGWDHCLSALIARLEDRAAEPFTEWQRAMEHYVEKFGLDEGEITQTGIRFARDLVWKPVEDVWKLLETRATNESVPAGAVTVTEAPRLLEYEWLHDGEPVGRVRWEILFDPDFGVRIELTQTIPEQLAELREAALAAWHKHLDLFFAALFVES